MKKINIILLALAMTACSTKSTKTESKSNINLFPTQAFETTINGKKTSIQTIKNNKGTTLQFTNYGARMVALWVPSRDGFKDVIWGYESIDAYLTATDIYAGPIVGRFGNRINKGKYSIDGKDFQLTINNGNNHLHGGLTGLYNQVWNVKSTTDSSAVLTYFSPDGEGGYGGNANIEVKYTITSDNALRIDYKATTDAPTPMNLTSHSYFNLHGTSAYSTNSHIMQVNADKYTPTNSEAIPTGVLQSVEATPFDFRKGMAIGKMINDTLNSIDLVYGKGYDHNFVLNKHGNEMSVAATVYEPSTGIEMQILTDQIGLQFYSGNFMDGVDVGKRGDKHNFRTGIALETQNFPDAPNQPNFPNNGILQPNETYTHTCVYKFGVRNDE